MIVTVTWVDPYVGDSIKNAMYASCEVCSESFVTDIIYGREPRDLYLVEPEHLKVCSECLPDFDFWEGT